MAKPLEIFKPGTFTSMEGQRLTFSAADVAATVAAYDPALHKAPLVIGHPKTEDPAYGWVASLSISESGSVLAEPEQVHAEFAEGVNDGLWPKISTSFWPPDHASNPVPGVWYPRHIGFLGAAAPAVKGLRHASFADDADGVMTVDFAEPYRGRWAVSSVFRRLREYLLETQGVEVADRVVPDWAAQEAAESVTVAEPTDVSNFSDNPKPEDSVMDPNKKQADEAASFAERETQLATREAKIAAREKAIADQAAAAHAAEVVSFADGLVAEGKLLPNEKDGMVSLLQGMASDQVVSFAEGDQTVEKPGIEFLRSFLSSLPARVDFAERSAADDETGVVASFAAPAGYTVDADRLAMHNRALAYQQKYEVDYATAAAAVGA